MYSKILLAVDTSESSELLVEHLPHLIKVGLKEVVLVHVVNIKEGGDFSEKLQAHDKKFLQRQKAKLEQKGIKIKVKVPIGLPSYEINEIADKENVSLIIIGSHSRSIVKQVVLGGTSEQIIRDARKPVLIMKLDIKEDRGCSLFCKNIFKAILYPTDFSNDAEKTLPYIKKALDAGCEKVVLLHVQEEAKIKPHLESRLEEFNAIDRDRLNRIKKELLDLGAKNVKTIVEMGKAIPIILKTAEAEGACLIALGARGRSLFGEMFIGSTANNVARYARMPVLFVT
ncbi:MAG: universal stress protein [Candidatus Omnitrophica bacterium]|nr:universal stress protein [Candidatus Omnitrophota bacterium]MBU4140590.1 universal stress protein [Candidatus Omnitrophota bacterium]